ncbi:hypothetical protein Pla100_38930 [Neorhodopirellula pilleata]|uniref:Uncharacterized protein n=1 Tax=Neorhodopirellula pilleata TaxID=2714738 RepID=A0A5C6A7L0_9BACT|nr:hypothetical protein Pla100_38930 [Neorhodopirellula pilleata]
MLSLGDRPFAKYRPVARWTAAFGQTLFCIESLSNEASAEVDLSGRKQPAIFHNASVVELEHWHRLRFEDVNAIP